MRAIGVRRSNRSVKETLHLKRFQRSLNEQGKSCPSRKPLLKQTTGQTAKVIWRGRFAPKKTQIKKLCAVTLTFRLLPIEGLQNKYANKGEIRGKFHRNSEHLFADKSPSKTIVQCATNCMIQLDPSRARVVMWCGLRAKHCWTCYQTNYIDCSMPVFFF